MPHPLSCPDCGARVPADHVNLDLLVASCPSCDAVFSFAEQVGRRPDEGEAAALPEARAQPVPARVGEREGPDGLVLSVGWRTSHAMTIGFFALVWNGMLAFKASVMVSQGQLDGIAFMGVHAAAGAALLYYAVASALNTTDITVNAVGIDVAHGPLPWPGATTLRTADIDQLFVEKRIIRGKNSSRTVYDLKVTSRSGQRIKVATGLPDYDDARFLEQRIEGYLGIEDRPVRGEHAG